MSKRNQTTYERKEYISESSSEESIEQRIKTAKNKITQKTRYSSPESSDTEYDDSESCETSTIYEESHDNSETNSSTSVETEESSIENDHKKINDSLIKNSKVSINETGEGTDLTDTCYKKIDNTYSIAKYLDLDIIVNRKTSFVNCSNMIRTIGLKIGKKKLFAEWKRTDIAKEFYTYVAKIENISVNDLFKIVNGGRNITISGTYCHPLLVPTIASWMSPPFGIMATRIVNEYSNMHTLKLKDKLIKDKDNTIDELNISVKKVIRQNNGLKQQVRDLMSTTNTVLGHTTKMKKTLDIVANDRVIHTGKMNDESVVYIMRTNDIPVRDKKTKKYNKVYGYGVIRIAKKSLKSALSKFKENYPNMEIIKKIKYTPNSINLWTRIRDELRQRGKIEGPGCKFNLINNFSESRMIRCVETIHDERLNIENM